MTRSGNVGSSIKKKVTQLTKKFDTCNPFEIAEALGIEILYEDLGKILGYYNKVFRIPIIHINEVSTEQQQLFTCAHELGHAVLHPNENTSFLKSNTHFSTDRIEVEANTFAIELLFAQGAVGHVTVHEATEVYGIPEQLLIKNFYT